MTQPMHPLLDALRGRSTKLAVQAEQVIGSSQRLLEYTLSTFPGGTDHTARHTATVERIGRMLLPDSFLAALTDDELFLLVVACHYHDLAMAGTEADDATVQGREQVRRDHAVRVANKIVERWAELGFEEPRVAAVLGEVCRGHRPRRNADGEATWEELDPVAVLAPGIHVRVRLVSALVYAIDELHLGADRAPLRVERWRELQDEESRRHWRRHQAVTGPSGPVGGALLFQVDADTPGFEENLRAQVLRKALAGLADLRRQALADGVTVAPLPVHVQWNRMRTWELLLPVVCSDLVPRTKPDLVQALLDRWRRELPAPTPLGDRCVELGGGPAELEASARRCVEDAVTLRHLRAAEGAAGGYLLATKEGVADVLFGRARAADETDRLFLGHYTDCWEERLFESLYGRAYVSDCVLPAVDQSYSVRFSLRPPTDPLRVVIERCPTAARLVQDYRPPPSSLVKEVLLRQAVVAGVFFDLHAVPDRILNQEIRAAVRSLTATDPTLASVVRLVEELALVGGFTGEQVGAAHALSDAALATIDRDVPSTRPGVEVTICQTVPVTAPAATSHLTSLVLASHRAETPIQLTSAPGHALEISVATAEGVPESSNQPVVIGVGPAQDGPAGPRYLPARIELNRAARAVRFVLGRFGGDGASPYPVAVRVPVPPPPGQPRTVGFGVIVQWPNLTVRDLKSLDTIGQWSQAGGMAIELVSEDGGQMVAGLTAPGRGRLVDLGSWDANAVRGLRGLDGKLPAPLFVTPDDLTACAGMSASDRGAWWQKLGRQAGPARPDRWSVFWRVANPDGAVVEETFLRFLPFNLFNAPQIGPDGSVPQADLDRQWESGEADFKVTGFFDPDVFELGRLLRVWCQHPRSEFPLRFRFGSDDTPSALTRSVLTVRFPRAINRGWHRERQIVFEARPVSRREAYELEAIFWRASGQEARAVLAEEILGRIGGPTGIAS